MKSIRNEFLNLNQSDLDLVKKQQKLINRNTLVECKLNINKNNNNRPTVSIRALYHCPGNGKQKTNHLVFFCNSI